MINYGKANVKVTISSSLVNIDQDPKGGILDVSARQWENMLHRTTFPALLMENINNAELGFSVCHPSKRIMFVDNIVNTGKSTSTSSEKPVIKVKPIENPRGASAQVKSLTDSWTTVKAIWENEPMSRNVSDPLCDDVPAMKDYAKAFGWGASALPPVPAANTITNIQWALQKVTSPGVVWGIETEGFPVENNTPFWVNIERKGSITSELETFFMVSFGLGSNKERIDICISDKQKPKIIDWSSTPKITKEFPFDTAKLFTNEKQIEIGVMTIAGRLMVYVNKDQFCYIREGKDREMNEIKITSGKIAVFGSNVSAKVNISPMTFAFLSAAGFDVASPATSQTSNSGLGSTQSKGGYLGIDNKGKLSGPIAKLPTDPETHIPNWGVDCKEFSSDGPSGNPVGTYYQKRGKVGFFDGTVINYPNIHILLMAPEDLNAGSWKIPYGGCPYFFELRGALNPVTGGGGGGGTDISKDVLSIMETVNATDFTHIERMAVVTLYNKGGTYDYLKAVQKGITIDFGWNSSKTRTFTGVTVGANSSEIPGKETLEVQCYDYMYVLKNAPIMNSPYYDGMIDFYIIKDLAKKAGINKVTMDWSGEEDQYFVPSSSAINAPVMKFPPTNKIFDCMIEVVKKSESYIYFDEMGALHSARVPGGVWADTTGSIFGGVFTTNPQSDSGVLLEAKNVEYTLDNTFSGISVMSVDKQHRDWIEYRIMSTIKNILFYKMYYYQQPALGSYGALVNWIQMASERLFYPTRRISFKMVGDSNIIINPFEYFTVDGEEFRLTSYTRKYNADNNDYFCEYQGEWLYGR